MALFLALSTFVLSRGTGRVYGFDVARDLGMVVEAALQVCPLFAALCLLIAGPLRDRLAERLAARISPAPSPLARVAAVALVSAASALAFLALTAAAVWAVTSGGAGASGVYIAPKVWLSLLFDLLLIGIFTHFVHALTRRGGVSVLLFLGYVVLVVVAGPALHVTEYIGFGSTTPVVLTAYDPTPVGFEAAWAWRLYWSLVTLTMLALLHAFDAPPRGLLASLRSPGAKRGRVAALLPVATAFAAGLAALHVSGLRADATRSYAAGPPVLPAAVAAGGLERPTLERFAVDLAYAPERRRVEVRGTLTLVNDRGHGPLPSVLLEKSPALRLDAVDADRPAAVQRDRSGRLVALALRTPLGAGERLTVRFQGSVDAANPFDRVTRSLVFSRAFYLTSPNLLPLPRRPDCFDAPGRRSVAARCDAGENYLLTDASRGRLSVTVPADLQVAGVGTMRILHPGGTAVYELTLDGSRLTNFFVAGAAFGSATLPARGGVPAVTVYGAKRDAARLRDVAGAAQRAVAYYQGFWPRYPGGSLTIVEAPSPMNEATAYSGAVAINEKLLRGRAARGVEGSGLARLVVAHELAHQWWGYAVVPAREPGRLFVLESTAQFAAYSELDSQGILPADTALAREQRRYLAAVGGGGLADLPLSRIEREDWLAYHKGPFVLLRLDRATKGGLMPALGTLLAATGGKQAVVSPGALVDSLIQRLPAAERTQARTLLTTAPKR
ncbi:MAG TPA: hypothetical protein VFE05_03190 [Longimicrobiaceae bacterium]|nr:hypothetical protein [Longimicrobiaceae bacterium]